MQGAGCGTGIEGYGDSMHMRCITLAPLFSYTEKMNTLTVKPVFLELNKYIYKE